MDSDGDCLGVVLAGGRSQRMGADKARLRWHGQTLLDHALEQLRGAGCTRVLVSGSYQQYLHVPDRYPDCGPLGGLASIAEAVPESRWLVVAIDQPLVDAAMLRPLLTGLQVGLESARGICRYGEEPLPMALTVQPATRQWLRTAVRSVTGHRSLKALHDALRVYTLPADASVRARLRGANTPAEWHALLSMG